MKCYYTQCYDHYNGSYDGDTFVFATRDLAIRHAWNWADELNDSGDGPTFEEIGTEMKYGWYSQILELTTADRELGVKVFETELIGWKEEGHDKGTC